MNVRIDFETLQDELFSQSVVDLHCDRNSENDICEISMTLQDGTEIAIKAVGNSPIVFERNDL